MSCECDDLRQILALLARIAQHNDLAEWDEYGEQFTEDAVMHCFGRDYVGRDAIVAFTARRHIGKHMLSTPMIEIDGDQATVSVDYAFYRYPDLALFGVGVYKDLLVEHRSEWKLARREIIVHAHHPDMTAAAKQTVAPIADSFT
jgi:3-phenylpropionate/cinnamic acid dioxygenase small subunit